MVNSGTLYFSGRPVMDVLDDFLKPQEAKDCPPIKVPRADKVVVVVDVRKRQLQRLQRIAERTRKQRIKRKVANRISQMEQCS